MDKVKVYAKVEINPTESEEKVRRALVHMFGDVHMQTKALHKGHQLVAEATGLDALSSFQSLLRREHIRSAARGVFYEGLDRNSVSFCLNKQVAFSGHVSFSKEVAESPLGPIRVKIECDNPRQLIDWLAPRYV
jgi:predicted RNA binding protein with dsRBD fold (UPF0201 family)